MIYMQVEELTKSVGDRMLFQDVTFGVNEGDKIGIVAKNGTGKSTMLRIIAGLDSADSGTVTTRTGIRTVLLEQEPTFPDGATVATACPELTGHPDRALLFERLLGQMGLDVHKGDAVTNLSGGQRKRLAIARAIASEPDLLILDEPTNHLDIPVIEWLEGYLRRSRMTLLMVTHDRYFLDRVCNTILEIDRTHVYMHNGNYDYYLRRRAERIEAMGAELAKVRNTLRREQDWMSRQPQARGGKDKGRKDRFYDLKERSRIDLREKTLDLKGNSTYIGSKIFEADHISKRYGDKVILDDFNYVFARYDKVGIVGPNGVGKSTLIKMLQGLVQPDSGHFDIGETVRFGYYSQDGIAFDRNKKVIDAISEIADDIEMTDGTRVSASQFLSHFLFPVPDQQKYIHTLSGGELCRLHLATVLMRRPNFLILDEPTNDLDLVTLGVLEEYLSNFKGCCLIVSHDRFFLDNIVEHLFVMEGNGTVRDFAGNYTEYREWQALQQSRDAADTPKAAPAGRKDRTDRPVRLTFKEKKELEQLTADIDTLTAERTALEAIFNSGEVVADIADKARRYEEVKNLLDEKEMRWLELSEKEN